MGFFGHLVVTRSALPEAAFPAEDVEAVPGQWADGLHVTRIFERLGDDWGPFDAFVDRLAQAVPDGFLSASILDSDGAFVHIAVPYVGIDRCWLNLDGLVSHFVIGPPPFDEGGEMLPDDEIEALNAETERETLAYAARCASWRTEAMPPQRRAAPGRRRQAWSRHRWRWCVRRSSRATWSSRRPSTDSWGRSWPAGSLHGVRTSVVAATVLVLAAFASGCTGTDAPRSSDEAPSATPTEDATTVMDSPACEEVRAGIDAFNLGDFEETVEHFELAVPLAEEQDDGSETAGDLVEAVQYYADLAPTDYPEAARSSAEFLEYKNITLGQCRPVDGEDTESPGTDV